MKKWFGGNFHWQDGYVAFSYGKQGLDNVYKYIVNQELHHQKRTFREENTGLLKKFGIGYDSKFLFEFFE